jgi:hypothetical protein
LWQLQIAPVYTYQTGFINVLNRPQYAGGYLSDATPAGVSAPGLPGTSVTSGNVRNFPIPSSPTFLNPTLAFSSNPRSAVVTVKFIS